jgi:hypothetical protein
VFFVLCRKGEERRGCLTASSSTRGTVPSASSPGSAVPATAERVRLALPLAAGALVHTRLIDSLVELMVCCLLVFVEAMALVDKFVR